MSSHEDSYDIILVGAGISGVNFAYRIQERLPNLSYTIIEGRDAIGGTWDLFKYPGLRSDSDLFTFGFPWRPWIEQQSIAEGALIVKYVRESAEMYGIDKKIQFGNHVNDANFDSKEQAWSLNITSKIDGERKLKSKWLFFCTGYYDYDQPLQVSIPGIENFKGKVVHPQFWPEDLDYSGKQITIIGSGATAITLLPALSAKATHVTLLQRSPSYVLSQPSEDGLERLIRRWSPKSYVSTLLRYKWITLPYLIVTFCRYLPTQAKKLLRAATSAQLPKEIEHDPHFNPSYDPFQQRVCFCPDGDFYKALRTGNASIVTARINTVTPDAIKLDNNQALHPDIIVTATGLKMQMAGGIKVTVDDQSFNPADKFMWKNVMLQDLPNAAFVIGYVDASWTLGADATAQLICRMLKNMAKKGETVAVPRVDSSKKEMKALPYLNLTSTYVTKAKGVLPKAGDHPQWRGRTNYFRDIWQAWFGDVHTGMQYLRAPELKG